MLSKTIKVLERRYNTHDQAAKSVLTLALHSLKQETGESGAEFVDRIIFCRILFVIHTTPNITFYKASGLFEGMEHAGLAPLTDSVNYSNVQDKGIPPTNENLILKNPTQGPIMPVDRDLSRSARITSPETVKENVQFATIQIILPISVPILTRLDLLLRSRGDLHLLGEKKKEMMGMSFP
jgi:hypothetical protein